MQNQQSTTSAKSGENKNVFNSSFIQLQPTSNIHQGQNMTPVNINTYMQQSNPLPIIALRTGSGIQQYIPVPQGTSASYLRFQVANTAGGFNYVQIPTNNAMAPQNSTNKAFIPIRPQLSNQQVSPPSAPNTNLGSHFLIGSSGFKLNQATQNTQNQSDCRSNSLVGSVTCGEVTSNISVNTASSENRSKPVQQFIIVTSPMKNDSVTNYIQTLSATNQKSNVTQTANANVGGSASPAAATFLGAVNAVGTVPVTPKKTLVKMQTNLTQENLQQLFNIPQPFTPPKAVQTTLAETTPMVVVSSYQKQQVLVPKSNQAVPLQQRTLLLPMSGNLVTMNQVGVNSQHNLNRQHQQVPQHQNVVEEQSRQQAPSQGNHQYFVPVQVSPDKSGQYFIQSIPNPSPQRNVQHNRIKSEKQIQVRKTKSPVKSKSTSAAASSSSVGKKAGKKPCNCTKSQCLKLYCECFANGEFCNNCNCRLCLNNIENEAERSKAIKVCLDRNPSAFHPKIGKGKIKGDNERRHTKGCNCKRSGCLKNYCECYEAKILCSSLCRCSGCKNFEESADRKTLMHLADAAEERVLQQNAAKTKLASQMTIVKTKSLSNSKDKFDLNVPQILLQYKRPTRLPHSFITNDVIRATCDVMLARAQEVELSHPPVVAEGMIIDEFSQCLNRIILKAKRACDERR